MESHPGPQSPFNPFTPSPRSAGAQDEELFFEAHMNLAPMPDMPPPPPPFTPREATIAQIPEATVVGRMPNQLPPPIPSSQRKKKKKDKKDKDKKKDKLKKKNGSSSNGRSYSQYDSVSSSHDDGSNIVHYETEEGEGKSSLFSFCKPKEKTPPSSSATWVAGGNADANGATPKVGNTEATRNQRTALQRINIGELNSAAGEGTTIPQILAKMRFLTVLLSALTIAFEAYAMFFHAIFLHANKMVLGAYLYFFIGLLLCFEAVRGTPVPTSGVRLDAFGNGLNAVQVAEIVWKLALEKRWARQVRYFFQNNFGILYSCVGRGVYFCFVGSLALGQGFLLIEILGACFMLMGLWTISLSFRYPALEKAMLMDLEDEFGERQEGADGGGSVVSWSSIRSSSRSDERSSLLK